MDQSFVTWLEDLRDAVEVTRATWKKTDSKTGSKDERKKRDTRLDHVLPMQFEHDGRLHWAHKAHRIVLWSALSQLLFYVCVLVAVVCVFARRWVPDFAWVALALIWLFAWIASAVLRRRERPVQQ